MSQGTGVFRLFFVWAALVLASFYLSSDTTQRVYAAAKILVAWPATEHWRVPVGSFDNRHPPVDILKAIAGYPDIPRSTKLIALQSALFATLAMAALYGVFREFIWGRRESGVRRVGHGPRLISTYPEDPLTRIFRAVILIAAVVAGGIWIARMRQRFGGDGLESLARQFIAALRVPELQRDMLAAFTASLAGVGMIYAGITWSGLAAWVRARAGGGRIRLGGIPIARPLETNHFLLGGSTGTGKTELALDIARTLSERGDRAVFIDYGANFLTRLSRTGDFILNPFDQRSVCWSPWLELRAESDYMMMARAIVPDGFGESRSWHGLAQQLVAAALRACAENGRNTIREFLALLISSSDEFTVFSAGTPASVMTQKGNEKMFANTRNVLMEYLEPWRFLREPAEGEQGFSIRSLIEGQYDQTDAHGRVFRPWLFMTFRDDQRAAMQYLSATWMELVIRAKLSLSEDRKRRIWEFIDELAACKRIQSLPDELAFVRKKGGAAVIGVQDVAQIRGIYGPEVAQTMLQNLKTKVMLACADPDTARYFSDVIGEQRILRRKKTVTPGRDLSEARRISTSWEPEMHRLVTYSEIMCLPVRRGYLRLPDGCVQPIKVPLTRLKPEIPAFMDR